MLWGESIDRKNGNEFYSWGGFIADRVSRTWVDHIGQPPVPPSARAFRNRATGPVLTFRRSDRTDHRSSGFRRSVYLGRWRAAPSSGYAHRPRVGAVQNR